MNENFEFVISKSMHEPPSPLRKSPKGNPSLLYFPLLR